MTGNHTAVSIPVKEGEEAVEFPTAIAKTNEETWNRTGCRKSAHAENGIWLDNLYEICMIPHLPDRKPIICREKSLARSFAKH